MSANLIYFFGGEADFRVAEELEGAFERLGIKIPDEFYYSLFRKVVEEGRVDYIGELLEYVGRKVERMLAEEGLGATVTVYKNYLDSSAKIETYLNGSNLDDGVLSLLKGLKETGYFEAYVVLDGEARTPEEVEELLEERDSFTP